MAWMLKRQELGAETGSDWPVRGSAFKTRTKLLNFPHCLFYCLFYWCLFYQCILYMFMMCFISSNTSKPCLKIIDNNSTFN